MIPQRPPVRFQSSRMWFCGLFLAISLSACDSWEAVAPEPPPPAPETPPPAARPPEVITSGVVSNLIPDTATLHGSVNPNGHATEAWFEWGTSATELSQRTPPRTLSGTSTQAVSASIGSMEAGRTYYFRIVARNDGGSREGLTAIFRMAPRPTAPGRTTIAFVREGNIFVYSEGEGGGDYLQLTVGGGFGNPSWSPDGRRIAAEGPGGIHVLEADGSGSRVVGSGWSPAWSPDGLRLAYSDRIDGNTAIFVSWLDDWSRQPIRIGFDRGYHGYPAWSPDGTRIAFISDWEAFDFAYEIYVADADGSDVRRLTDGFFGSSRNWPSYTTYRQPAWSPDGRSLSALACPEWQYYTCAISSVVVMSSTGPLAGRVTSLVTATTGLARPTWAPDGSGLVFSPTCWDHKCGSSVVRVGLEGGDQRLLIGNGHSAVIRP